VDAVATTIRDTTLLLDIDVQQLPGPLTLVAHHLPGRAVQISQLRDTVAMKHGMHGGVGLAQRPTNAVGTDSVGCPILQHGLFVGRREPPRAGPGA